MKLQFYAIAAFTTAMSTLCGVSVVEAIVATNQTTLKQSQVIPGQFSGVVGLFATNETTPFCTGSLLTSRRHILTAAHCLRLKDSFLGIFTEKQATSVGFNLASGFTYTPISNSFIFPDWDGLVGNGNDIAVLLLAESAPPEAEQYDIYRDANEIGKIFTKVGYGDTGVGTLGSSESYGFTAYFGQNQFEATEADAPNVGFGFNQPAFLSQLLYDFDNGLSRNNVFGSLGLGQNEVNIAPGDSGGPAFIGDRIAGITSYGALSSEWTDIDFTLNFSFGEFAGDTRVSTYATFIDQIIASTTPAVEPPIEPPVPSKDIPESSMALGTVMLGLWLRKHNRRLG
jgi:secreted trypsin-like serine protease